MSRIEENFILLYQIVIEGKERTIVYALVGNGATISLFHVSIAEDIGIELETAE